MASWLVTGSHVNRNRGRTGLTVAWAEGGIPKHRPGIGPEALAGRDFPHPRCCQPRVDLPATTVPTAHATIARTTLETAPWVLSSPDSVGWLWKEPRLSTGEISGCGQPGSPFADSACGPTFKRPNSPTGITELGTRPTRAQSTWCGLSALSDARNSVRHHPRNSFGG